MGDRLFDALADAAVQLDRHRVIVQTNAAAGRLTGWPPAALVGQECASALVVRDRCGRAVWTDGWPPAARLPSVRGLPIQHLTLRCADGTDAAVTATGTYLRDGCDLAGALITIRPARGRARPDEASAIEVVSTVSHELRSPLTSIKGYTSLMLARSDLLTDDDKRQMLGQINHDADRVVRLIGELLDISRLESGRLVLRRQMIDLAGLTARVVSKLALQYPRLEAEVTFAPDTPAVWADPDKVEQVLTNLVENACKYATPEGLTIRGHTDDAFVNVVVTDRGEGIPSEDLPRVFSKFFRRSEGTPTGSGLGLWISRGLVEAHGGQLTAASSSGQGASFRFTLPIVASEDHPQP